MTAQAPSQRRKRQTLTTMLAERCTRSPRLCCVDRSQAGSVDGVAGLDNFGQFVERRGNGETGEGVGTEFVVAAAQVVHEGMPADHDQMRFGRV